MSGPRLISIPEDEIIELRRQKEALSARVAELRAELDAANYAQSRMRDRAHAAEKRLAEVTSPEYLEKALNEVGVCDVEYKHRCDRLVSALREIAEGCTGRVDRDSLPCRIASAALSASGPDAVKETARRCVEIARQFGYQILVMWDRPGGPPGNGYRALKGEDVAQAIAREFSLEDGE